MKRRCRVQVGVTGAKGPLLAQARHWNGMGTQIRSMYGQVSWWKPQSGREGQSDAWCGNGIGTAWERPLPDTGHVMPGRCARRARHPRKTRRARGLVYEGKAVM